MTEVLQDTTFRLKQEERTQPNLELKVSEILEAYPEVEFTLEMLLHMIFGEEITESHTIKLRNELNRLLGTRDIFYTGEDFKIQKSPQ